MVVSSVLVAAVQDEALWFVPIVCPALLSGRGGLQGKQNRRVLQTLLHQLHWMAEWIQLVFPPDLEGVIT